MADRLITNEDLVALYCGGAGGTHASSPINTVLKIDPRTFNRGNLPSSDVADIYVDQVKTF